MKISVEVAFHKDNVTEKYIKKIIRKFNFYSIDVYNNTLRGCIRPEEYEILNKQKKEHNVKYLSVLPY